jgi:hypothetical protein
MTSTQKLSDTEEAKIIKASLELQKKVGTGSIDENKVKSAQKVMNENKVDFGPIAKPHLDEISGLVSSISKSRADQSDQEILQSLMTPTMNIKANAATFNYPLISGLTGTVLMFLEDVKKYDRKVLQIVDLLHKTILLVMARKMTGDGGAEGKALQVAFQELCQKFIKKLNS